MKYVGLIALLALFTLCGAKQHSEHQFSKSDPATTYVDPSDYAMHPTFAGFAGDTAVPLSGLRSQIDGILSAASRWSTVSAKIVFFNANNQVHTVYDLNPELKILPASNEKLFTSSATIWALGADYKFTTKLELAPGAKLVGSTVQGNLYLRPSGDPTLVASDFDLLAKQLRARGITRINGSIISDISGENELSQEAQDYLADQLQQSTDDSIVEDNGSVLADSTDDENSTDDNEDNELSGALSQYPNFAIDRNVITVTVRGGTKRGKLASVQVSPPLAFISIRNSAKTGNAASRRTRYVGHGRHRRKVTTYVKARTNLEVRSVGAATDLTQVITVSGTIAGRSQRTYRLPIKNVPLAVAAIAKLRLARQGISVAGQAKVGKIPAHDAPLKVLASKETGLIDLLSQMNKRSDNYLAECMFRKLSTVGNSSAQDAPSRSRAMIRAWLNVCNIAPTSSIFADGSGLSKQNRTTASTVIDLLTAIRQQGLLPLFSHTLSIAGSDGTLRNRMKGTSAQFNAHGKTGTLNGVSVLGGYVVTADGQLAAYFITTQGFRGGHWASHTVQDKVVEALAAFKYDNGKNLGADSNGTEWGNARR